MSHFQVALVGNPNSGKSTFFNQLTGLRQKTGNFPGVTVDIKEGKIKLPGGRTITLIDLPGTYSMYPTASDEKIAVAALTNRNHPGYPDAVIYVADATNLEKHLLLLTQISDLGLPVICVLNFADNAAAQNIQIDVPFLTEKLGIPCVLVSARSGENLASVLFELEKLADAKPKLPPQKPFYQFSDLENQVVEAVRLNLGIENPYLALLTAHHHEWLPHLSPDERLTVAAIVETKNFQSLRNQVDETLDRFEKFTPIIRNGVKTPPPFPTTATDKIDNVLTHRFFGPFIFAAVMLLIFQAIYDWSTVPMDFIESVFTKFGNFLQNTLPSGWLTDLLTDGVLAGLSGILVFVPQIFILFLLITILEEVGYMARVVFMFDKMMRRFGMNGRSVVSLISGSACAVPAIMATRTIGNWRERLVTVMVTPFISCSARIPVYAVLIGLAVPAVKIWGVFGLQSLVFGWMYLLGVLAAFGAGWVMKKILRSRETSFLAIELPVYRMPHWRNVWLTVGEKTGSFVFNAGKIILIISIILWAMASFGPGEALEKAEANATQLAQNQQLDSLATTDLIAAEKLEASWAGVLGKAIEPAIRPLGYDWKIGIALITSFAAREVFVGTMSTIYSIGSSKDDEKLLREKMRTATFSDNGRPVYTLATALSLLVFYALAMQCMSTMAVVRRETGSWKWPIVQFFVMGAMAWVGAWVVYSLFS